jgi:hypothetical protein|tara:strand:+ start:168 stop:536 length:369 start_codon:yes stop_codon:yes gene_type:complete
MTKVVVSYESELEDIPNAVSELILNTKEKLRSLLEEIHVSAADADNGNILESLEKIDNVRKELAKIDVRLLDCSSILSGYVRETTARYVEVPQSTQEVSPMDVLAIEDEFNVESTTIEEQNG